MAGANNTYLCVTDEANRTITIEENQYIPTLVIGVFNSMLSVPTAIANALVIAAIFTTPDLQTPSYLLLTSLAFSDLIVGLVCQPFTSVAAFSLLNFKFDIFCFMYFTSLYSSIMVTCVSGFTITAISVDRYLAITLKMRYRSTVTLPRIRCLLVSLWIVALVLTSFPFYSHNSMIGVLGSLCSIGCLLTIVFCYAKSFRALKVYCNQIQPQGSQQENNTTQSNAIDVLKYKKLLNTMMLILGLIVICYSPLLVIFITLFLQAPNYYLIFGMLSIVGINSTLNPIVYVVRMRDIRQACIRILKKLLRC